MARIRSVTTMAELSASMMAAFNAINEHYYNGELEKPVITFKEGKRKSAYGWIETRKQWVQGKNERYEINISIDYIGDRSVEQSISTLMHEMAHLYNLQHSIKDTSRGGVYHNKKFKETAETHGLIIEFNEHIGWSLTKLKEEAKIWIKDHINIKDIKIYKRVAEKAPGTAKPKQSMKKLVCPCCGAIARVTSDIQLICGECFEPDTDPIYLVPEEN
ncbi:MAG: SprT-like domain-containing protein [Oscillospiraceae bacterium]